MQTYEEFKSWVMNSFDGYKENRYKEERYEFFRDIYDIIMKNDSIRENFSIDKEVWGKAVKIWGNSWNADTRGYSFARFASRDVALSICVENPEMFSGFQTQEFGKAKEGKKFMVEVMTEMMKIEGYSDKYNKSFLDDLPPHMRRDPQIALMACQIHGSNYYHVSEANGTKENIELIKAAIQTYPQAYVYIPNSLKSDMELARTAVDLEIDYIEKYNAKLPEGRDKHRCIIAKDCSWLWNDKAIALKAVQIEGRLLENFRNFINDEEVVMEAVKNDGSSLGFATKRIRAIKDICIAAISNNARSMSYVDDRYKSDIEFCLNALRGKTEDSFLQYCDLNIRCDKAFVQLAIEANPINYQSASNQLKMDKDIYEPLIKVDGPENFEYLPYALRNDIDVVIMALETVQSLKDEFENSKLNGTLDEFLKHRDGVKPTDSMRSNILTNVGSSILRIIDSKDQVESEYDTYVRRNWRGGDEDKERFDEAEKKIRLFKLSQSLQSDLGKEPPAIKPKRMKI